ncbi:hypothetical protein BHM03_00037283 [Ensete ventricosum]|uniref:Uncharacterized protein n=1 Tax=Ensete ventricosum TaxID=4639 RepID=A0A445MK31_ENSVE|nr:hypothetical protein BHM03_00037283 [Ensete ventricosum]
MTMNLKEGSHCVVNRGEDLTAIDFNGDVSLVETKVIVLSTAWLEAIAAVEDSAGSDRMLMEEKAAGNKGCSGPRQSYTGLGCTARAPRRRRVAGATPFSCRGGLWWEQATDDADNGSSLTVGADVIDNDAKATVISGIAERGSEIGKVVNRVRDSNDQWGRKR